MRCGLVRVVVTDSGHTVAGDAAALRYRGRSQRGHPGPTIAKTTTVQSPALDLASWSFTVLDAKAEMVDFGGERVPALRLSSKPNTWVGLASTALELPHDGYVVEFDYRVLRADCPFASVSAEPAFSGVNPLVAPLREVDSGDGARSPRDRWCHYRAEFLPLDGDREQISIWIDDHLFRRFTVPQPGKPEGRLHLRVVDGDMQVARVRVSPLERDLPP